MPLSAQNKFPVSVVIATLGGDSIVSTIEHLNLGSVTPSEILICIPKEDAFRLDYFTYPNVSIIKTSCRGQVAQRAVGLKLACNQYVLQMDDDIQLQPDTISLLLSKLKMLGRKNVIGPVYYDLVTKQPIHSVMRGIHGVLKHIFYLVFCGAAWGQSRMGKFTSAGIGFGVDPTRIQSGLFFVEWLPGGCVLSYKDDLVGDNFFPYSGKAYCEDFIHSYLRSQNGIKHWVDTSASCMISRPEFESSRKEIAAEKNARRYFVKISKRSFLRLRIYELTNKIRLLMK